MDEPDVYFDYYFNDQENCFYLGDRKAKIKDFFMSHKDDNLTKKTGDNYIITFNNYMYKFDNPRDIEFIFPFKLKILKHKKKMTPKNKINIFVSSHSHIGEILLKYENYDFYYSEGDNEEFILFKRTELKKIYPKIKKIKFSNKKYDDIYSINNHTVKEYSQLDPKYLSLSYDKYLKYSDYIRNKPKFFNLTKKREDFFNLLDDKLKSNNIFLPIGGPEGIGKTSSILAYCKIKVKSDYFYFNTRTFYELMKENNKNEIKNILTNELARAEFPTRLDEKIKKIMRDYPSNCNPIDFLITILDNINYPNLLIIDQYKTALDDKYKCLKNLLDKYKNAFNIILLCSMNEDDVKGSFDKGIKNKDCSGDNFFLDYLYIRELAEVSEKDLQELDNSEIEVLNRFGNLYSIFYEIIEFKRNNHGIFNEQNFLNKISNDIRKNLKIYFKTEDKITIYKLLMSLINIELSILSKEEFLKVYFDIPFRYFKFSIDDKNIFEISQINSATKFKFEYLYNYFLEIIVNLSSEIYNEIQKDNNYLDNVKKGINPLTFENNAFLSIWANRGFNGDSIEKVVKVSSIYDLSQEDCDKIKNEKKNITVGKGFILSQTNPTAQLFDIGILIQIKENIWRLYLIQITQKKDAQERITIACLDDFFGFICYFLKEKCEITVEENYFCYIFDEDKPDNLSIKYCNERKLNYIFYKKSGFKLNYENRTLKEYKMKKKIIESLNNEFPHVKEIDIKKFYPKNKSYDDTKSFLKRKRKLSASKDFNSNEELIKRFNKKKTYYDAIKKFFGKEKNI